jgi:hypothetical protein
MSGPDSPPQAAAPQPGYFGVVAAPPRSLCAQVRPAAAARGDNARKSCLLCSSNLFCRWIIFSGLQFHPSSNHVEWQQGKCEQKRGREDYSWHVACFFNFEANRGTDAQEACSKSLMFSYSLSSPLGPAPSTPGIRSGAKLSKRHQSISKRARVRQVGASIGAAHLCSWPR